MKSTPKSSLTIGARGLLVIAAGISAYLAWLSLGSAGVAGCGDGASCNRVLSSPWAKVFGLPVALIGTLTYLAAAGLGPIKASLKRLRLALLLVIPAAAAWFIGVQLVAIGSICPWCCSAHLLATAGALGLLFSSQVVERRALMHGALTAVASISLLAVLQFSFNEAELASDPIVDVYQFNDTGPETSESISTVSLLGGQISFELAEMPLVGVSKPKQVVVALMDYTCPHCRKLHDVLQSVGASLGGEVAILKLPATRSGTESADIHRQMLALWKVDPKMHWTLERGLIEGRIAPTAAVVHAEAVRMVGPNQFAEANVKYNRWITEQLAKTRKLQDANREKTGKGTLPQVMIGSELVIGAHTDPAFYLGKVEQEFGMVAYQKRAPQPEPLNSPQPIELEDGIVELGNVTPGTAVPFRVVLTNQGRDPLEISWLNMGANLGLEEFSREEIDPDQKLRISLVLNVPEDARAGALERSVTVNTKTGHDPISFRVVANIGQQVAQATPQHGAE